MVEDAPLKTSLAATRPTPEEVVAMMSSAIAMAPAEGIAIPPDLARKTFVAARKLAARRAGRREG